jgi:hypothetical protein
MKTTLNHETTLKALLDLSAPLPEAIQALRPFGWDSEQEIALLTRAQMTAILQRYLQSQLSASDVEGWANAIEGREDIGFEPGYGDMLRAALFALANPELTQPLTVQAAQALIENLR